MTDDTPPTNSLGSDGYDYRRPANTYRFVSLLAEMSNVLEWNCDTTMAREASGKITLVACEWKTIDGVEVAFVEFRDGDLRAGFNSDFYDSHRVQFLAVSGLAAIHKAIWIDFDSESQ